MEYANGYKPVNQPHTNNQIFVKKQERLLQEPPLLLQNFSRTDILDFLGVGVLEKYSLGDPIMKEGEPGNSACLIVSGLVSIWKYQNLIVTLHDGEFIGEMFLFSQSKRIANVIAEENTQILRFHRKAVLDHFRLKPERLFKIFIMNIISIQQRKIEAMDNKIITLQHKLNKANTRKENSN